jgi:hypothetical protein
MEALIIFIVGSWVIQGVAAVVLAIVTAVRRRRFAALGAVLGFAVGLGSLFVMSGPRFGEAAVFIVVPSAIAMIVSYGLAKRWMPVAATLLLLVVPLAYFLTISLPPRRGIEWQAFVGLSSAPSPFPPISATELLATIGLMEVFFLAPILGALAAREVLGWLDRQAMQQDGVA